MISLVRRVIATGTAAALLWGIASVAMSAAGSAALGAVSGSRAGQCAGL
ncbi:hypothetical protein [Jiangella alba]|uniref:Uncharacterized protein n=1 Tax=Jiangella alba TaxID=561176 RepID=A0A1H5KW98_9ACTN|nr:hypothetical protein [Jiangella alba]SEE69096.1 hypothetical protein SAMN04488561_2286 [Jiangella alba]